MARIEWRAKARADLDRLFRFLWVKDEGAADRAIDEILNAISLLKSSPRLGRLAPGGKGHRELTITFGTGAYIASYTLKDDDTVVILRLFHSREWRE
jgi:plasmid stabilization system protein ParE